MAAPPAGAAGAAQTAGALGGLFGGAGSGSGRTFLDPGQNAGLQELFRLARSQSGDNTFAGFDPLQIQGQESALQAGQNLNPLIQGAQSANQFLLGDVLNPDSNPFLRASADSATRGIFQDLNQNVLPGIGSEAGATGNVGSSRQGIAQGLAAQGALQTSGDVRGDIFSRAYGQGLNALTQGLNLAPQTANLGLFNSQLQQDVGGQRRGLEQQRLLNPFQNAQRFQELLGAPITLSEREQETKAASDKLFGGISRLGKKIFGF